MNKECQNGTTYNLQLTLSDIMDTSLVPLLSTHSDTWIVESGSPSSLPTFVHFLFLICLHDDRSNFFFEQSYLLRLVQKEICIF